MAGPTLERVKATAKRSRLGVIAGRVAVERTRDVRRLLGRREGVMGATHRRFALERSVDYVDAVVDDYIAYGGLDAADLDGMRVLELGPGDNLGVALKLIALGAERVVATDRFVPIRDPEQELRIYAALLDRMPAEERSRVAAVAERGHEAFSAIGLELLEETPIEDAPGILGEAQFDLVVSRAVLEHVHDLEQAFDAMDALLSPGGLMVHKVDLRDHGLFTKGGHDPLTFLTVSDRVYRWMGEESAGLPNRHLIGWYRDAVERRGYDARFLVSHVVGVEEEQVPHVDSAGWTPSEAAVEAMTAIRPRLLSRFRSAPDAELAVAGFVLVARKPARSS